MKTNVLLAGNEEQFLEILVERLAAGDFLVTMAFNLLHRSSWSLSKSCWKFCNLGVHPIVFIFLLRSNNRTKCLYKGDSNEN